MAFQRRRHHERMVTAARMSGMTAISAAALFIFMVLAFLTVLAPPLVDQPAFPNPPEHSRRARRSSMLLENPMEMKGKVSGGEIFRVPNGGDMQGSDIWESKGSRYFYGCSNASKEFEKADAIIYPDRYLMISTSGGLNQQRTGITDAVVAARILNATLVVPTLDQMSFWKDASNFTEVFDVEWFISSLSKDVKIVKELPSKGGKVIATPYRMRVPRKCTPRCYQNRVFPALLKKRVVQLTKFDYRLSNKLENDLQKLRCRVNYHALRFTDPIRKMGETLIKRMKSKSKHFIALHLRFEPDMLAFSGCYYGGGDKERLELGTIRKRWKNLHESNPDKERRQGRCPLTPEEVGLMLRALGFGNDVHIYVASGEVYGGEETLAPLKALFPNFHSKDTLASKEELSPFLPFSSRMAALDYIVCDESDVFVTNNNGNMAKMLAGRRRYFGHKRTIRPNAKKLYSLCQNRTSLTWDVFASKIRTFQKGFMGEPNEIRPGRGEFHENPSTCICETKSEAGFSAQVQQRVEIKDGRDNLSRSEALSGSDEQDWGDWDYGETVPVGKALPNRTAVDYDHFLKNEDTDLEEFSD
ncbi:O-fucosyltransferase 6 [Dendrobium catenatum]|nr:O-fucosyltransferase 6 [Dendrobium catenatum]